MWLERVNFDVDFDVDVVVEIYWQIANRHPCRLPKHYRFIAIIPDKHFPQFVHSPMSL